MNHNLIVALFNIIIFVYLLACTFLMGYLCIPKRFYLKQDGFWNLFFMWFAGYYALTCVMIVLGLNQLAHSYYTLGISGLIISLGSIKLIKRKTHILIYHYIKHDLILKFRLNLLILPVLLFGCLMFWAALVPPTKVDELNYYLYFSKEILRSQDLAAILTPYEVHQYMAMPIFNVWPLSVRAEYVPALNSVWSYFLMIGLMHQSLSRLINKAQTWMFILIASISVQFIVNFAAPGDNAINSLCLFLVFTLAYEIHASLFRSKKIFLESDLLTKLFWFSFVSGLALMSKLASIFIVVPLVVFFYVNLYASRNLSMKKWLTMLGFGLALAPFLYYAYVVCGHAFNPILAQLSRAFDASEGGVVQYHSAYGSIIDFLKNLLTLPSRMMMKSQLRLAFSPLLWPLIWLCIFYLWKRKVWYCLVTLLTCCLFAQIVFYVPYERFYLGVFLWLGMIGWVGWIRLSARWGALALITQNILISVTAGALLCVSTVYAYPMIKSVIVNESRDSYMQSRVGSYNTIQWVNSNLLKESFLIIEGQSRYLYDIKTEKNHRLLWSRRKGEFLQKGHLNANRIEFLKQEGVTHLMTVERHGKKRKDWYYRLCQNRRFAKLIYENNNEIVSGRRVKADIFGITRIYQLV
ncbi:MAG: hypothetical protein ACI9CF_000651 [Candidatus Omnitrophota bacterium]|jgi:hypothetical protein